MQDQEMTFHILEVRQHSKVYNNYFKVDVLKNVIETTKKMRLKYPLEGDVNR